MAEKKPEYSHCPGLLFAWLILKLSKEKAAA